MGDRYLILDGVRILFFLFVPFGGFKIPFKFKIELWAFSKRFGLEEAFILIILKGWR